MYGKCQLCPPSPAPPAPPVRAHSALRGAEGPQYARIVSLIFVCHPVYPGTPHIYPWIKGSAACSL